jgi:hypothetical protein
LYQSNRASGDFPERALHGSYRDFIPVKMRYISRWTEQQGHDLDGVVAKRKDSAYLFDVERANARINIQNSPVTIVTATGRR